MGFGITPPNESGPRPQTGGAVPGPKSRGNDPTPPNEGGARTNEDSGKNPAGGGFPTPPNETAHQPGYGGKM